MKARFVFLTLCIAVAVSGGCSPTEGPSPDGETGTMEIVHEIPFALADWASLELAQPRGARVASKIHDGQPYYLATEGKQSVPGGEIAVVEKTLESGQWTVTLEYLYPGITERSPEPHFLLLRVPKDQLATVSLAAATGSPE